MSIRFSKFKNSHKIHFTFFFKSCFQNYSFILERCKKCRVWWGKTDQGAKPIRFIYWHIMHKILKKIQHKRCLCVPILHTYTIQAENHALNSYLPSDVCQIKSMSKIVYWFSLTFEYLWISFILVDCKQKKKKQN